MWRKKVILSSVIIFFIITATAVVAVAPVGEVEVDYLEDKLFFVDGNITLVFDPATPNSESDLTVTRMFYSPGENVTVYQVQSNTIIYDWTFNNNTHNYGYFIQGTSDRYLIKVDYSSIQVPDSWLDLLNETIAEKDNIIISLIVELNSTRAQLAILNQTLGSTKVEMEEWKAASNVLKDQRDTAIADKANIQSLLDAEKEEMAFLEEKWKRANTSLLDKNSKINNLETILGNFGWLTFYEYNGKSSTVFNFPSMIIGIIICLLFLIILRKKLGLTISNPLLLSIPGRIKDRMPKDENKHVLSKEYGTDDKTIENIEKKLVMDGVSKKESPVIPQTEKEQIDEIAGKTEEPEKQKDVETPKVNEKGGVNVQNSENKEPEKNPKGKYVRFLNKKIDEGMTRQEAADEWRRQKAEGFVK